MSDARFGTVGGLAWALEVEDFAQFLAPLTADTSGLRGDTPEANSHRHTPSFRAEWTVTPVDT